MPVLMQKIADDLKSAMLAREEVRLSTLRMLKSAVKNLEVSGLGREVTDEDILGIIRKQMKQRDDSAKEFEKASRPEMAAKESAEKAILAGYLPAEISDEELRRILEELCRANACSGKKDFGRAMKLAREKVAGQAENRRISAAIGGILGA